MSKKDTEKLVNRAKELSSDGEYIRLFDEEENYNELIRNTELSEVHEAGSKEKALEMAKKLKLTGVNSSIIAESSGL